MKTFLSSIVIGEMAEKYIDFWHEWLKISLTVTLFVLLSFPSFGEKLHLRFRGFFSDSFRLWVAVFAIGLISDVSSSSPSFTLAFAVTFCDFSFSFALLLWELILLNLSLSFLLPLSGVTSMTSSLSSAFFACSVLLIL